MLRFITLFIILVLGTSLKANHYSGGQISYEYIGDSSGIPNHYLVRLSWVIHSQNLAATTSPQQICVRSSCFPDFSFMASHISPSAEKRSSIDYRAFKILNQDECVASDQAYFKELVEYRFEGALTLPGNCGDFIFSAESDCCREDYDNLLQSISKPIYVEAELNNLLGTNNSPDFQGSLAKVFCKRTGPLSPPFEFPQYALDPDGDSLVYELVAPEYGVLCGPGQLITYAGTFTPQNPILSNGPVYFDQALGNLHFKPASTGNYLLKVKVKEYRKDGLNRWVFLGSAQREVNLSVNDNCRPLASKGPAFIPDPADSLLSLSIKAKDSLLASINKNDLRFISGNGQPFGLSRLKSQNCFTRILDLQFSQSVICGSVVKSDFEIIDPQGYSISIDSVDTHCEANYSDRLSLHLSKPLVKNGHYLLLIKEGQDQNTLLNKCHFASLVNTAYLIPSFRCPNIDYEWDLCSIEDDFSVSLAWSSSPGLDSLLAGHSFKWQLSKKEGFGGFKPLQQISQKLRPGIIKDPYHRQAYKLDSVPIYYELQFVLEGTPFKPLSTRPLLLEVKNAYDNFLLRWNVYEVSKSYRVQEARFKNSDVLNFLVWEDVKATDSVQIRLSKKWDFQDSTVAYRVLALDDFGEEISCSNYLFLNANLAGQKPFLGMEKMQLCNFFSPNGDGVNDRFHIYFPNQFREHYSLDLKVYDRNGILRYSDPEFHLHNSSRNGWDGIGIQGSKCAPGNYFYLLRIIDHESGQEVLRREHLSIRY